MSKTSHVIKNQPFTAGSIGRSSDVTIMLGCGDRRQAYMCYRNLRGHTVLQCHGVSLQTHWAMEPFISTGYHITVPFHIVKLWDWDIHAAGSFQLSSLGCISHVSLCSLYNSFLFLRGPCLFDLNQTVWLRSYHWLKEIAGRTKLCDSESFRIDKCSQGCLRKRNSVMDFRVFSVVTKA